MLEVRDVEYTADGAVMAGRLILPEGTGKRPAVLVAHEAGGLGDFELSRARRLAGLGYVALAVDYHGGGRVYTDRGEAMARLMYLGTRPESMRAIGRAAVAALIAQPRVDATKVAAIGYCFGAVMMLELARDHADLKAVIGFHPGAADHNPADSANITGKVLVCIGSEDPWMPAEQRLAFEEEMRAAGVDWQMDLYGGARHSFTNPGADTSGMPELGYHEGRGPQVMAGDDRPPGGCVRGLDRQRLVSAGTAAAGLARPGTSAGQTVRPRRPARVSGGRPGYGGRRRPAEGPRRGGGRDFRRVRPRR